MNRYPRGIKNLDKVFCDNLARKRYEAGLSYRGLAQKVGVSGAYLYQVEVGIRHPTLPVISKIARALGMTVAEILSSRESL